VSKLRQRSAKRITIKDVAQAAGVSVTTVSNVLNGRAEAMAKDTLLRVQETIRILDYYPNRVARSLVTSRTATIGTIINEIDTPLYIQTLNYIEPIARNAGYNTLLCVAHNLEDEQQVVNLLLEKQVDGIILLGNSLYLPDDYLNYLPLSAPPIVLINHNVNHHRFDQIGWDNVNAVAEIVDYLVQLGHRRIAHLSGPETRRAGEERLAGYRLGLEKHALEYCEDYVRPGDFLNGSPEQWTQSTQALLALPDRPTAIIASNDIVAAVVIKTIQQAGLQIPQDITVVGFDNQSFCAYLSPTLTTILIPIVEAGKLAIEILLARIADHGGATRQVTLPCSLIVRESSGAVAH
jgi:DNA-binding LacI/PurR family transcriptional regulator